MSDTSEDVESSDYETDKEMDVVVLKEEMDFIRKKNSFVNNIKKILMEAVQKTLSSPVLRQATSQLEAQSLNAIVAGFGFAAFRFPFVSRALPLVA